MIVFVDIGLSINVIDEKIFEKIRGKVKLRKVNNFVFVYGLNIKFEINL